MDIGSMARSIIGVAVVIIVIITVAIPIIGQFTEEKPGVLSTNPYDTAFDPDDSPTQYYYYLIEETDTIEWNSDAGYTINGEHLNTDDVSLATIYIVDSSNLYSFNYSNTTGRFALYVNNEGLAEGGTYEFQILNGIVYTDIPDYPQLNATHMLIKISVIVDALSSRQSCLVIDIYGHPGGGVIDEPLFINNNDVLFALTSSTYLSVKFAEGLSIEFGRIGNANKNWSDVTLNLVATDNDSVKLDSISFVRQSPAANLTIVFPSEYYTDLKSDAPVSGATGDIIAIIPLIMVVGVLIGAVGLFVLNRRS